MNEIPTIFDIQATGLGPRSYPAEIGVVLASGEKYRSLIQPESDWIYWSAEAERIHHIRRDILGMYGRSANEVCKRLNQLLKGTTIYSDGWLVNKPWLIQLFHQARVRQCFTVSALEMILNERQMAIWHETKDRVIKDMVLTRHRASFDAMIIQKTYTEMYALTE
jgi:hypothetical protein